jgi:hypothetical protein
MAVVGKKGEPYTLEMQELGMELMSRGLPAPEARAMLVIFMKAIYPDANIGRDYRIPDPVTHPLHPSPFSFDPDSPMT